MPYQQAVGAYGLDLPGEVLGPPEGRALALQGAKAVMDRAFDAHGDGWAMIRHDGEAHVRWSRRKRHYGENRLDLARSGWPRCSSTSRRTNGRRRCGRAFLSSNGQVGSGPLPPEMLE